MSFTRRDHHDKNVVSDIYSTILIPKMDIVDVYLPCFLLPSYTTVLLNVSTTKKFDMFSTRYESTRKYYVEESFNLSNV